MRKTDENVKFAKKAFKFSKNAKWSDVKKGIEKEITFSPDYALDKFTLAGNAVIEDDFVFNKDEILFVYAKFIGKEKVTISVKTKDSNITLKKEVFNFEKGSKWSAIKENIKSNVVFAPNYVLDKWTFEGNKAIEDNFVFENDAVILISAKIQNALVIEGSVLIKCDPSASEVTIPAEVKEIKGYAFSECNKLTAITIPGNVKIIGSSAFDSCSKLKDITISNGVETIYKDAFNGCTSLKKINIPASTVNFNRGTFDGCILTELTVDGKNPEYSSENNIIYSKNKKRLIVAAKGIKTASIAEGCTEIGGKAFSGCAEISSIKIPESVKKIYEYAFYGCRQLKEINIPKSVENINENAFSECGIEKAVIKRNGIECLKYMPELKELTIGKYCRDQLSSLSACKKLSSITVEKDNLYYLAENNNLYNKKKTALIRAASNLKTTKEVLKDVRVISNYAFIGCNELSEVVIPKNISSISEKSLAGCSSIKKIVIDNTDEDVCKSILETEYENLQEIEFSKDVPVYNIFRLINNDSVKITISKEDTRFCVENGSLYSKDKKALLIAAASVESVKDVLKGVENINNYAFSNHTYIKEVAIPESVKRIGEGAFTNCASIESISIPKTVVDCGNDVFEGCYNIKTIKVDSNQAAFEILGLTNLNSSLESIAFGKNISNISAEVLSNFKELKTLTVDPENASYSSKDSCIYKKLGAKRKLVRASNNYSNEMLKDVTIIGDYAFKNLSIKKLDIPASVVIEENAVEKANIETIVLRSSNHVGKIFGKINRENFKEVILGKEYDFWLYFLNNYPELEKVSVEAGNNKYSSKNNAVYSKDAKTLYWVEKDIKDAAPLLSGVTIIESYAFSGCTSLKEITIPKTVTSIGYGLFSGCVSLEKINIPETVTEIGGYAFNHCTSLKEITIPKMVTSIGYGLFSGCVSLEKVNIPEGVTTIEDEAFSGCTSLKEITIPKSLSHISSNAFENCRIEKITIKSFNGYSNLKDTLKYSLKEAVISDVTQISTSSYNGAFEGFNMLEKVTIKEGVTTIESEAFRDCTSLKEITIPKTVTSIGYIAFRNINEGAHFTVGSEAVKNILITDHNISADKITVK